MTTRIAGLMVAVSLVLLTVGIGAAGYLHYLQGTSTELLVNDVVSVRAAEEIEIGIHEVRYQLNEFLHTGDRAHLESIIALQEKIDHWLNEAERTATTPREQAWMSSVKKGYQRHLEQIRMVSIHGEAPALLKKAIDSSNEILTNEVLPPAHEYLNFNEQVIAQTSQDTQRMTRWMALGLVILGTCGAAGGLLAGFGIARGLNRSLIQLSLPVRDAAGKLNQVVGPITVSAGADLIELERVFQEIDTHVGTVVRRLQQSQREVLRADQLVAVGQLAAGMAHEVLNPLTAMKMLVEAAAEYGDAAYLGGQDVAVLRHEITRVEGLIQTFLDFARPPEPEMRTVNARDLVDQTVRLISTRAEQQGVQIETDMPTESLMIHADPGQIRQVILNLLFNALDVTPAGGTITVRAIEPHAEILPASQDLASNAAEPREGGVTLSVADTGTGLPLALGERIFEPFVSTKETGIGLGLSICMRIVEAHGGRIKAVNGPARGAVFTVHLPGAQECAVAQRA